jgi:hypothetical protein
MDASGWTGLQEALADLDFPADKWRLVEHVQAQTGDPEVRKLARSLPLATYRNISEIRSSVDIRPATEDVADDRLLASKARAGSGRVAEHLREAADPRLDPGA